MCYIELTIVHIIYKYQTANIRVHAKICTNQIQDLISDKKHQFGLKSKNVNNRLKSQKFKIEEFEEI